MIVRPAFKVLVIQCLVNPDRVKIYVCMYVMVSFAMLLSEKQGLLFSRTFYDQLWFLDLNCCSTLLVFLKDRYINSFVFCKLGDLPMSSLY